MANEHYSEKVENSFSFLEAEDIQAHFANLNIELLRSKHIQSDDVYSFQLLSNYEAEIRNYYFCLYGLKLIKDKKDLEDYYYLEFPEEGKGKLSDLSRYKELTGKRVVIGLMLINIYHKLNFSYIKKVTLNDIYQEIKAGEYSFYYKSVLLNNVSDNYSNDDWIKRVEVPLKQTIREFAKFGWVKIVEDEDSADLSFILKASINRLVKLYQEEILNFEEFAKRYDLKEE